MAKNPKRHQLRSRKERIALGLERTVTPRPILPERHLFVTEGTKTEPNYLYGIAGGVIAYLLGRSRRGAFIAGVVGVLQMDVLEFRLKSEYGVNIIRESLPFRFVRWIVESPRPVFRTMVLEPNGSAMLM